MKNSNSYFHLLFGCVVLFYMFGATQTWQCADEPAFHKYQPGAFVNFYTSFGKNKGIITPVETAVESEEYKHFLKEKLSTEFGVDHADSLDENQTKTWRQSFHSITRVSEHKPISVHKDYKDFIYGYGGLYYGNVFDFLPGVYLNIKGYINDRDQGHYRRDYWLFRRLVNAFFGLAFIYFGALIGGEIFKRSEFFVLPVIAFSPYLFGMGIMQFKDVPFAAGYVMSIYFMIRFFKDWVNPKKSNMLGFIIGAGISIGSRPAGVLVLIYFVLFLIGFLIFKKYFLKESLDHKTFRKAFIHAFFMLMGGYILGLLFWPYGLISPINHTIEAIQAQSQFQISIATLFNSIRLPSAMLPWYYLPHMIAVTASLTCLVGLLLFTYYLFRFVKLKKYAKKPFFTLAITLFALLFPIIYIVRGDSNVYAGWRHVLFAGIFVYIFAGVGFSYLYYRLNSNHRFKTALLAIFVVLNLQSVFFIISNLEAPYVHFNFLGGKKVLGKYETDHQFTTLYSGMKWLRNNPDFQAHCDTADQVIVATSDSRAGDISKELFGFPDNVRTRYMRYRERYEHDFDYGIFNTQLVDDDVLQGKDLFPPSQAIHAIELSGIPVTVIERGDHKKRLSSIEARFKYDNDEGIDLFNEFLSSNNDFEAYSAVGNILNKNGRPDLALGYYKRAYDMNPLSLRVIQFYVNGLLRMGKKQDAISMVNNSLSLAASKKHTQKIGILRNYLAQISK